MSVLWPEMSAGQDTLSIAIQEMRPCLPGLLSFGHVCGLQVEGIEDVSSKYINDGLVQGLFTLQPDEPVVEESRARIEQIVDANLIGPADLVESFSEFRWLLDIDPEAYLKVSCLDR